MGFWSPWTTIGGIPSPPKGKRDHKTVPAGKARDTAKAYGACQERIEVHSTVPRLPKNKTGSQPA